MSRLIARWRQLQAVLHTKYISSFVFVHINKTGGSSVERALRLPFRHRTAREIRDEIGERQWAKRFKFTFVRNPWDKVASHYHYRITTNRTGLRTNPIPFPEWVRLAYEEQDPRYFDNPRMFMPQLDWITDQTPEILVDFVGRFERLSEDFAHVARIIGRPTELPHLKRSENRDYRLQYDDRTAEIVAEHFAKDIAAFGYSFD